MFWGEAGALAPTRINSNEWVIRGWDFDAVVKLQQMTCTCKMFDLEKPLCEHALRATREIGENKFMIVVYSTIVQTIRGLLMKIPYIPFHRCWIGKSRMRFRKWLSCHWILRNNTREEGPRTTCIVHPVSCQSGSTSAQNAGRRDTTRKSAPNQVRLPNYDTQVAPFCVTLYDFYIFVPCTVE